MLLPLVFDEEAATLMCVQENSPSSRWTCRNTLCLWFYSSVFTSLLSVPFFSHMPSLSHLFPACPLSPSLFSLHLSLPPPASDFCWLHVPEHGHHNANSLHHHHWPTWLPTQEQLGSLLCLPTSKQMREYCIMPPPHALAMR